MGILILQGSLWTYVIGRWRKTTQTGFNKNDRLMCAGDFTLLNVSYIPTGSMYGISTSIYCTSIWLICTVNFVGTYSKHAWYGIRKGTIKLQPMFFWDLVFFGGIFDPFYQSMNITTLVHVFGSLSSNHRTPEIRPYQELINHGNLRYSPPN